MKTEFEMDDRVRKIVRSATRKFKEVTGMNNQELTSDFLLYSILQDENAVLTRYMIQKRHFSADVFTKLGMEMDASVEYAGFNESMEEMYYWVIKANEERINTFYTQKEKVNRFSEEVSEILNAAEEMAQKKGQEKIDEQALSVSLVQNTNVVWDYWKETNFDFYTDLSRYFTEKRYLEGEIEEFEDGQSPKQVEKEQEEQKEQDEANSMFFCLNDKFDKDSPKVIRGREVEIEKAFVILQKMTTRNVALIGEPGVGKSAIAEGIAECIVKETCPKEFIGKKVMSLDINSLMENTSLLGQFEQKVKKLTKYLEDYQEVIMFIDEMHNIMGAGRSKDSSYDFANGLKPLLVSGKARVIGATTEEEYEKWISKDGALKRRFEKIKVEEPKSEDLYEMLGGKIYQLSKYHNVSVSEEIFNVVVSYASGMNYNVANPARTVDLLDTSMVIAKSHGKNELDVQSILEVYRENIKKYNILKKEHYEYLYATAYHEVGHYLLHQEFSKKFDKVTYVSIIPADDYLGVNVFEANEIIYRHTKQEFIEKIATDLAGDVATELKFGEGDAGKSADLQNATRTARIMVLKYGMQTVKSSTLGSRNGFVDEDSLSDQQKNDLARQTDELLNRGYELAKKILKNQDEKLELLAEALMQEGALDGKTMESLYKGEITLEELPKSGIELIK